VIINREKYLSKINTSIERSPITVLIGARQVGKTSLLKSVKPHLTTLTLDGQITDTQNLFANTNTLISFLEIKLNKTLKGLLIIDEFQMINKISSVLKILADSYNDLKILCSGSSSLDIIQQVEESLAGRIRMIYVNSLSFSENILFISNDLYKEYQKYSIDTDTSVISPKIQQILNEQLIYGGMPRVSLIDKPDEKIQVLFDIYQTYILRDVKSYVRNQDSVGFNKLLTALALQTANIVNVNELSRTSGLSYNKCIEYIYLLEQMFIIKLIEPYETNRRKAITKMKKVFFLDIGIRNIIIKNFNNLELRSDTGALFENFVFLELLKKTKNYYTINYFRTRDGAEVDFVINNMKQKISIEVKYKSLNKPVFYKALRNFNLAENISQSFVINLQLNTQHNNIYYLPAYLLDKINI
jgi:predicted AAA+ superfamily ATPase